MTGGETAAKVGGWAAIITGGVVLLAVFVVASVGIHALLLLMLWNWFIPSALGLPPLGWSGAIGICLVASALRGYRKGPKSDTPWADLFASLVTVPLMLLAIGWLAKELL